MHIQIAIHVYFTAFTVLDIVDDIHVDPAIIDKLTEGTLGLFLPNLQKAKGSLNEVL